MQTTRSLGLELGIDGREVRAAAEAFGLGRWLNSRMFVLADDEVEPLRSHLKRIAAGRRTRSAKKQRTFATPTA